MYVWKYTYNHIHMRLYWRYDDILFLKPNIIHIIQLPVQPLINLIKGLSVTAIHFIAGAMLRFFETQNSLLRDTEQLHGDWSWYSAKLYQGIRWQNFMNVSASFLCSQATFYCGAWDSCWDCTESFSLTVGRTQNTIPSKVLHRWALIFMVFVSNLGNWWHYQDLSPVGKLNAQKNGSVRTGPHYSMCPNTSCPHHTFDII